MRLLHRFALWLARKTHPAALVGGQWGGPSFTDAYRRNRNPTPSELLGELKGTAWTCASLNASVCAAYPPRLFAATNDGQVPSRWPVRTLEPRCEMRLRSLSHLPATVAKAARLEEVLDHPLLTLLAQVNPVHNAFDLWELTTLYQEVQGSAYWYLSFGPFGVPEEIWILPTRTAPAAPSSVFGRTRSSIFAIPIRAIRTPPACRPCALASSRYRSPRSTAPSKPPSSPTTPCRTPSSAPMKCWARKNATGLRANGTQPCAAAAAAG
jgi:hypothetical protein